MKVLLLHNRYLIRGGEDVVFEAERDLLRARGHDVTTYERDNRELEALGRSRLAVESLWSRRSARDVGRLVNTVRPDVAHVHNLFPLISPAVLWRLSELGIPVVMTLHNYRLACVNGMLLRDGAPCEACVGRSVAWPAVVHACYQGSRVRSAGVAVGNALHRLLATYRRTVHTFLAPTVFTAEKLAEAGLPRERMMVRPHFLSDDPGVGRHATRALLFVGRLAPEKGVMELIEAWKLRTAPRAERLWIVGDGPQSAALRDAASGLDDVEFFGALPRREVHDLMGRARYLVVPSNTFETFGLSIVEAFASGLPVLAADHGAPRELVSEPGNGFGFPPGDAHALARLIDRVPMDGQDYGRLSQKVRAAFEQRYSSEVGYRSLVGAYETAVAS